jgi:hypothetical protein
MRKTLIIISLGMFNLLHASLHLIQFIQSLALISVSSFGKKHTCTEHSIFEEIIHNPVLNILWGLVALITLYIGIKDFIHSKKCKH